MPPADHTIDVRHLGRAGAVACRLLETSAGAVLVDPGPASTLDTLRAALRDLGVAPGDLHALLLTHIHFDHAGAAGVLAQELPHLVVHVHPAGAPHLADPSRLVASATRIYGDAMDRLWGPILPVPAAQLRVLADGVALQLGERTLEVLETPGHAVHHAAFLDRATGIAYVGDTAGIRPAMAPFPLPVTPPPDVNLEAWYRSLDRIEAWTPQQLFITHFGVVDDPSPHLAILREELATWGGWAHALLQDESLSDAARADRFHDWVLASLAGRVSDAMRAALGSASDFRAGYHGLARYWTRLG